MSTQLRQLIFLVVFTLSILGLTAILIYSAGYRLDTTVWKLQPTGSVRVALTPTDDLNIVLLPGEHSSTDAKTSFTHLLPGNYQLSVSATGYQSVQFDLNVLPSTTVIIDPLRLWPVLQPEPVTDLTISTVPPTVQIPNLPISLANERTVLPTNSDTAVLLVDQFTLQRVVLTTGATETYTRLSRPISVATWLGDSPYLAYCVDQTIHILDSRLQTGYSDQMVAELGFTCTQLWYDQSNDALMVTAADNATYSLLLK